MTETVETRVGQLHEAADQLRRSSRRIQSSVQSASDAIDSLLVAGLNNPELQQRYLRFRGDMLRWSDTLDQFAYRLDGAALDISAALQQQFTMPRLNLRRRLTVELPTVLPVIPLGVYVSRFNAPLFAQIRQYRERVVTQEATLAGLIETRTTTAADLEALKHRLHSFDPDMDLENNARIRAMQSDLDRLDVEIAQTQVEIDVLQVDLDQMTERLSLVSPGDGADIAEIVTLENSDSPHWLAENTHDCVNHVVEKFHVPAVIANDAKEWVANALNAPQYGIQVGEIPLEGAVLVMDPAHPFADDQYGHLMYVEKVVNGEVWVTDNFNPDTPVLLTDITEEIHEHIQYLYFPWHTRG